MRLDVEKALADLALELVERHHGGNPDAVPRALERVHEEWAERAAIREYVGGMTRNGAEVAAVDDTRRMLSL